MLFIFVGKTTGGVKEVHERNFLKEIRKMTTKDLWYWKKHNFLQYLLENAITGEITVKQVEAKFGGYGYGYCHRQISDSFHELSLDGDLEVYYVSEDNRTVGRYRLSSKTLEKYQGFLVGKNYGI